MPSGAKKRKAAKKKKVQDPSTAHPQRGESDGGDLSSPASQDHHNDQQGEAVEVEKREDNSSVNKSVSFEKDAKEEEGNHEIDIASKSQKSHDSSSNSSSSGSDNESRVIDKKVVVLESAPVESIPAIESIQAIESLPEMITHKAQELDPSTIVDLGKPVDSSLDEASKAYDDTKNAGKTEFVVEETPVVMEEHAVAVNGIASKGDCSTSSVVVESVLLENGVAKLPSLDAEPSSESKDSVAVCTSPKASISGVNDADRANESETAEYSDRQPQVASTPLAVQKTTSWKSCCGILELFSGSER